MKTTKNYGLIVFYLFSTTYSFSQNFISEEKGWSVVTEGCFFREPPCYNTYYYKFLGDTLIGDLHYSTLYESDDRNKQIWHPHSYWRENSDSVFAYYEEAGQERLIYNFNLKVGDSIQTFATFKIKVDSIKTLEWGGKMRKHFYLSKNEYSSKTLWIEGVGSMANFIRNSDIGFSGSISSLLCFEENGQQVYQNPEFNSCYVYISSLDPFISENKIWSVVAKYYGSEMKENFSTKYYRFKGDTLIDGILYSKLYESVDANQHTWKFYSLWRESYDSVFNYYNDYSQNSNLIYRFNIAAGDSFKVAEGLYIYVDSIKNLEWGGKVRKHIYLSNPIYPDYYPNKYTTWIEGVGSTGNMTRSSEINISGGISSLLCFEEDGEKVYQNPEYNGCYIITSSVIEFKDEVQLLNLFPMGNSILHISLTNNPKGLLTLCTLEGKQLFSKRIETSETEICLPERGITIFCFKNDEGEIQTGKVLVK